MVYNQGEVVLTENEIFSNGIVGVYVLDPSAKAWILDNSIHDYLDPLGSSRGIWADTLAEVEIHGNTVQDNNLNVLIHSNVSASISFNTLRDARVGIGGTGNGLHVVDYNTPTINLTCCHNTFIDNERSGAYLSGATALIDHNDFIDELVSGNLTVPYSILTVGGSRVSILNNHLLRSNIGIRFSDGSGGLIANNLLIGQSGNSIFGNIIGGGTLTITISGVRGIYVQDTDPGNSLKILNNSILGTQNYGIEFTNAPDAQLINNILAYNTTGTNRTDLSGVSTNQVFHCYLGQGDTNFIGKNNNIDGELKLVNLRLSDYRLRPTSVAETMGVTTSIC